MISLKYHTQIIFTKYQKPDMTERETGGKMKLAASQDQACHICNVRYLEKLFTKNSPKYCLLHQQILKTQLFVCLTFYLPALRDWRDFVSY